MMSAPVSSPASRQQRGLLRRTGLGLLWYIVPVLVVLAVGGYVAGAVVWHANPPVVPVAGGSMRPALEPGDLVVLKGVNPSSLRKGDIIAVRVPQSSRLEYSLPGEVVHRIIKIQQSPAGPIFHTKGDANSGPDVFVTHGSDVVGRLAARAPGLGYPLLFFHSRQGKIFLGAAALIAVLYFLLGLFEERRTQIEVTTVGLQTVLAETEELKQAMERVEKANPAWRAPPSAGWPPGFLGGPDPAGGFRLVQAAYAPALEQLAAEVRTDSAQSRESAETLRELLVAVSEYGQHLRSHTAVMQGLAAATGELHRAASELRVGLDATRAPAPGTPATGATSSPEVTKEEPPAIAASGPRDQPQPTDQAPGNDQQLETSACQTPTRTQRDANALGTQSQREAEFRPQEAYLKARETLKAVSEHEPPLAETGGARSLFDPVSGGALFPDKHATWYDEAIGSRMLTLAVVAFAAGFRCAARSR